MSSTKPAFYRKRRRPLHIGSSVSDVSAVFDSAGTLGCFVRGRTDEIVRILSNNHVLVVEQLCLEGFITSPTRKRGLSLSTTVCPRLRVGLVVVTIPQSQVVRPLDMDRLTQARAAKALPLFNQLAGEAAVGVTRQRGGAYGLKVNLTKAPAANVTLPTESDGVPIQIEVVGLVRKRSS